MKCVICDDNLEITAQVSELIDTYAQTNLIPITYLTYDNPKKLLHNLEAGTTSDIYILDIIMPRFSGIDLAKKIRQKDFNSVIIFLTSSPEYTRDAYEVEALQYLEKPIDIYKFNNAIDRTLRYLQIQKERILAITTRDGLQAVSMNQIVYIESNRHVLTIYLTNEQCIQTKDSAHTITKLAEQLPFPPFIIPYKGFLVNMSHMSHITKNGFQTCLGNTIPIPARQFNSIKEQYTEFLLKLAF